MSIEQINGYNKLPSKDLKKLEPERAAPDETGKTESDARPDSRRTRVESGESRRISRTDQVDITSTGEKEPIEPKDQLPLDSLELSWRDPELVDRIRALVDEIKAARTDTARRIEAARILIMNRAYDDNDQLRKTAEAILRGEEVDALDPEM